MNQPNRTELGFVGTGEPSIKARDIAVPVATGAKKTMVTFDRRAAGTSWKFSEREGWSGCLRVDYPIEKTSSTQGMDMEICPVTSRGEQVKQKDAMRISESSPGWIEFDLPREKATQVAAIEFRARPYTWVRFANVSLRPAPR